MRKLFSLLGLLFVVNSVWGQAVVVNKYQNTGATDDIIELLVVQNNADLRNLVIKDFSSSNASDGGGSLTFKNIAFWNGLRAGTLIIIRLTLTTATDITTSCSDYNLDIGGSNTTYFTVTGSSDVATNDMVMIKSGTTSGVANNIHTLRGGSAGTQWTSISTGTKVGSTTTVSANSFASVTNANALLSDFNLNTTGVSVTTGLTFGQGNSAGNTSFINFLRGPISSAASFVTSQDFIANWSALNGATKYLLDVSAVSDFSSTIISSLDVGNVTSYTVSGLSPATSYYYRVSAMNSENTVSGFSCIQSITSLPVSFSSINATKIGKNNLVTWSTASEEHNRGFDVQRSTDGVNYTSLGFVNSLSSTGNSSSTLNYSFIDYDPIGLKQYYRLKQTDFDGTSRYSGVVVVTNAVPERLAVTSIYPNPASSFVHLSVASPSREAMQLIVTDANGRTVRSKYVNAEIGNNSFEVDATGLGAGVYYLSLKAPLTGWQSVGKFVKN